MKIAVCVKRELDARGPFQLSDEVKTLDASGLVEIMDPASAAACALAVELSDDEDEIVLFSVGDEGVERVLRQGLARGASRAVRIWDASFDRQPLSASSKARLLARAVSGFDAVVLGSRSLCGGSAFTGPALAEQLGCAEIDSASWWSIDASARRVEAHRRKEHGDRDVVRCSLPVVITVDGDAAQAAFPSLPALVDAASAPIEVLDANALDLSARDLKDASAGSFDRFTPPRPRVRKSADATEGMSSMDVMAMLSGGGGSGKSASSVLEGDADKVVDELFEFLASRGFVCAAE